MNFSIAVCWVYEFEKFNFIKIKNSILAIENTFSYYDIRRILWAEKDIVWVCRLT